MRKGLWGFALLTCTVLSGASTRGAEVPLIFVPRNSSFSYSSSSNIATVKLLSTDSDEPLRTASAQVNAPATTLGKLEITSGGFNKFNGSAQLILNDTTFIPFTGSVINDTAPLNNLDAFAFGISDGTSLLAFFQMRMAGSSATVSDTSLAAQAVSAGLWSSPTAYFEFPAAHAGIGLVSPGTQPTGPASYFSFVIPEPAGIALLGALAAVAGRTKKG